MLDKRSIAFAEEFVLLPDGVRLAREEAITHDLPAPSTGVCGALTFLATLVNAKNVVEIGTGTGATGLALFAGMHPDGVLTTIDAQAETQLLARQAFRGEGITTRQLRMIPGRPLDVLNNLRDAAYDLVLVGTDVLEYAEYLAQAERLLRRGGLVIINDALWQNLVADPDDETDEAVIIRETLDALRASKVFTPLMVPLGQGMAVAVRR